MVELRGILWRKLQEIKNNHVKRRKKFEVKIEKLKNVEKKITKSENCSDGKLDLTVRNLKMLNDLSRKIVKQNEEIIGLLKKKKSVVVSI